MVKGCIVVDEARESDLYPIHADTFTVYYARVTGQAIPADLTTTERRAFLVARAIMEEV